MVVEVVEVEVGGLFFLLPGCLEVTVVDDEIFLFPVLGGRWR